MRWPIEGHPSDDQKHRLSDWLAEMKDLCFKHQLLLDVDPDGEIRILDRVGETTIGFGLTYLIAPDGSISAFDCDGSILDGVWLVDTPTGPREQRDVMSVLPAPRTSPRPAPRYTPKET